MTALISGGSGRRDSTPAPRGRAPRAATGRPRSGAAPRRNDPTLLGHDSATEVRSVELYTPGGLVDRAQLGQGERGPDERRRDARELELLPNALDRVPHDLQVVECQVDLSLQNVGDGDQRCERN